MKLLLIMNEKCLLGNYALQIGKTGNFGCFVSGEKSPLHPLSRNPFVKINVSLRIPIRDL